MESGVFGPVENSAGTLPNKIDAHFQKKIEILEESDINLSVFFMVSYQGLSNDFENILRSKLGLYDQFKETPFDQKPFFLNKYEKRIIRDSQLGFIKNSQILANLQKLFSSLKSHNVGICLFYLETYDSCLKILKFCGKNQICNLFFYRQLDKRASPEIVKTYLLIPKRPNIPFQIIENFLFRSNRFVHKCGRSMLKSELLYDPPTCRQCRGDLYDFKNFYIGECAHGICLKTSCGVSFCVNCIKETNCMCIFCQMNHKIYPLDYAMICTSVASEYGICGSCKNMNIFSANHNRTCVDCIYESACSGRQLT